MLKWLDFAAVLTVLMAMAAPGPLAAAEGCDVGRLKHYPMTDVIERRAVPLYQPTIFFPDPNGRPDTMGLGADEAGGKKAKMALARGLKTFQPVERPMMMLAATAAWTDRENGLIHFFVDEPSVYIDEVLATLDAQGLKDHAMIIRQGRVLFGPDYGTEQQRYERWSDGRGGIRDPVLDANLKALSAKFRALPSLLDEAETRIMRSPALKAIYEPLKAAATDGDKLGYLTNGLIGCLADDETYQQQAAFLARLPAPYARIIVVRVFEDEVSNGSVAQFFYKSSGNFAPEVVVALNEMGLKKHAGAVEHGVDLFPKPYPTDPSKRWHFMSEHDDALANTLKGLTNIVDDGRIYPAVIQFAKDNNVWPR